MRRIIPPLPGFIYIWVFSPGLHRCAASPPGYHISPLNRGSRFRSPLGCRTPSLPPPCGGNFTIRRADNFTVLLSTISRCAATFHCAERRNFSTNHSRAFFTQSAIPACPTGIIPCVRVGTIREIAICRKRVGENPPKSEPRGAT